MPSDSTKTLVDLREEVSFHVGGVKIPRFLFPTKKVQDACRAMVALDTEQVKRALDKTASKNSTYKINPYCVTGAFLTLILRNCWALVIQT